MPSTRREVLASLGLGTATLAGCAGFGASGTETPAPPQRRVTPAWEPAAGTWPQDMYGPSNTRYSPTATPPRESPTVDWREGVIGEGRKIVVGESRVYVASDRELVALDPADGTRLWERDDEFVFRLGVIDDRLYALTSDSLRALTTTGELIWKGDLPESPRDFHEQNGYVYVGHPNSYTVLHADTGERVGSGDAPLGAMAVDAETLAGAGYSTVGRFTAENRTVDSDWTDALEGSFHRYGHPALADGTLYCSLFGTQTGMDTARVSLYDADGTIRRTRGFAHAVTGFAVGQNRFVTTTSTVRADTLGKAGALAAHDGNESSIWQHSAAGGLSAPVAGNGVVIAGPFKGSTAPVSAFDIDSGERLWQRQASGPSTLALTDETVYLAVDREVLALRP